MKNIVLSAITFLLLFPSAYAQLWEHTFQEKANIAVVETQDGGFVSIGNKFIDSILNTYVHKTDEFGQEIWLKWYSINSEDSNGRDILETADGQLLITGSKGGDNLPEFPFLLMLDADGNELWQQTYAEPFAGISKMIAKKVLELNNGNFLVLGDGGFQSNFSYGIITDPSGNLLNWNKLHNGESLSEMNDVILCSDGGLLFVGVHPSLEGEQRTITAIKTNINLEEEWFWQGSENGSEENAIAVVEYDNHFYMAGSVKIGFEISAGLVKLNQNGEEVFTVQFPAGAFFASDMELTTDNQLVIVGGDYNSHLVISKLDLDGHVIFTRVFENNYTSVGRDIDVTSDGGFIVSGIARPQETSDYLHYLVRTDGEGKLFANQLQGYVAFDENDNCEYETTEAGFENWIIKVESESNGQIFYGTSDENGFFDINISTGLHNVTVHPIGHYWATCEENITVQVDPDPIVTNLDIPIVVAVECPEMSVDIAAPFLRRCFDNSYTVNYCNYGTVDAEDATIIITLDPFLEMVGSIIPFTDLGNQQFEFDLGDVPINECETFTFVAYLNCDDTELGQVHCVDAAIFPNDICIEPAWTGPIIVVEKTCVDDEIVFTIRNIGGNMTNAHDYIVIEDNIILREETFNLNAGETLDVLVEMGTGSVYHLEAEQSPLMPAIFGDAYASSTLVNCAVDAPFFSYFLWFAEDDEQAMVAQDCQESIGSFDPNDKAASPAGIGPDHFIRPNIELEYKIRFQNTGTDTAFTVVIEDEIAEYLDLSSVRPGVSSHDYEFSIVDRKLLFTFNHIMLPDSNVNEAASHGFVKFKVDQIDDNPSGTQIFNKAAIYFDFNDPVITNQTFHTIAENLVTSIYAVDLPDEMEVKVFPNPFDTYVNFELDTEEWNKCNFELFNSQGQLVGSDRFAGKQYTLQSSGLPSGVYFYKIKKEQEVIRAGKVILK